MSYSTPPQPHKVIRGICKSDDITGNKAALWTSSIIVLKSTHQVKGRAEIQIQVCLSSETHAVSPAASLQVLGKRLVHTYGQITPPTAGLVNKLQK